MRLTALAKAGFLASTIFIADRVAARGLVADRAPRVVALPAACTTPTDACAPSSYAWPDATRPLPQDDAEPAAAKDGWSLMPETTAHTKFTFGTYDAVAKNCAAYNRWPLGLENRSASYASKQTDEQFKKPLATRPTTFVLGQVDTLPLGGFDGSCGAMA